MQPTIDEIAAACTIQNPITAAKYDMWAFFVYARKLGAIAGGEPNPGNPAAMPHPWGAAYAYMSNANAAARNASDQAAYKRWLAAGHKGSMQDFLAEQIRIDREINGVNGSIKTLRKIAEEQ